MEGPAWGIALTCPSLRLEARGPRVNAARGLIETQAGQNKPRLWTDLAFLRRDKGALLGGTQSFGSLDQEQLLMTGTFLSFTGWEQP